MLFLSRANSYRTVYDPLNPSNPNNANGVASTRDPYSDEGLAFLYNQMMSQYGTRDPNRVNPALAPYANLNTYKPPISTTIQNEVNAKAAYDAKIAADKLAYENAPITEANFDAAAYLKAYPEVGNPKVWQRSPYEHYLEATNTPGGNGADNNYFKATKLPFNAAAYTPAVINANPAATNPSGGGGGGGVLSRLANPSNASGTVDTVVADPNAGGANGISGGKTGGLMSIDYKKRAKTKPRKGLLAA